MKHTAYVAQGLKPFDTDRARLLGMFHGLADAATDPRERREWTRPLLSAGVPLDVQMWLWLCLGRYRVAPETNEELAVHDACLLETVGAVGVAMALLRAGQTGASLKSAVEAAHASIAEAEFLTPAGRRLGVRRVVSGRRFLKDLEDD